MPAQPRIETVDQALSFAKEQLERTSVEEVNVRLLWESGLYFFVGVRRQGRPDREVWIVGPRGGFERWIAVDDRKATRLVEFLL